MNFNLNEIKEIADSPNNLPAFSRYKFVTLLETNYRDFLDLPYFPQIYDLPVNSYFTVTLSEEDRIDKVSYKVFGNTRLWWVICIYNKIENPYDLPMGFVLKIPSLESLYNFDVV